MSEPLKITVLITKGETLYHARSEEMPGLKLADESLISLVREVIAVVRYAHPNMPGELIVRAPLSAAESREERFPLPPVG